MNEITLKPIGILHCSLTTPDETPKSFTESNKSGVLEINEEFIDALDDIKPGDTIMVLFWFHQANRTLLKVHPRGDASRPLRGVFSTRSPDRPNPIAVSELTVTSISGNKIEVSGVDAFNETPVLDIKNNLSRVKQ